MDAAASSAAALTRQIGTFSRAFGLVDVQGGTIPAEQTFLEWCEELGRNGMEVDGHPFKLDNRPALRAIYEAIPATRAEGYNRSFAIMKGAQTGLTVLSFLLQIYLALKYSPAKVGIYYPDRSLASYVSSSRFMPVVRSIPVAHKALLDGSGGTEGNVLTRRLGKSEVLFLWTSGGTASESFPLSAVVADEVQNMLVDDIERIRERMSASDVRLFFACSTAKWPGADIDFLFQRGDQRRFHTRCRCSGGVILDEVFPACIELNEGQHAAAPLDWIYVCPVCKAWIPDSQDGEWVKHNPASRNPSFHFPQTLSPTVSPREIMEAFSQAQDLQNFYNRKLGKPWTDPSQVPITLAICERQAEAGMRAGVTWKPGARGTCMGLDQMDNTIYAILAERMTDGRMAVIHVEIIYDADPWTRCSELMDLYGVAVCCVETLPDTNGARRFANRHLGRVFLAGYADLRDDMMVWGDQSSRSERRTAEDVRTRYTVTLSQYKAMQMALYRIRDGGCLFPDPAALHQDIIEKGVRRRVAVLREVTFYHFTKTALVVEQDPETRRPRARVVKITTDPHSSYAFMLMNVAWARAHGTSTFILPGADVLDRQAEAVTRASAEAAAQGMPGLPAGVVAMMADAPPGSCGRCTAFEEGHCTARGLGVGARDPGCIMFDGG